jgi:pimeloyl-ACP methyl ester carboxylesterase
MTLGGVLALARWLGPWSDPRARPAARIREESAGDVRVRIYDGGGATFVIAPGYSELGPDDPRLDRYCRILAAAGHRVVSPFIRDYQDLICTPRAVEEFARVVRAAAERSGGPVRVFSISVGSVLALHVAADHPQLVERLVVFGGYAELHPTLEYCLTGACNERRVPFDPSNHAIVALNVIADLEPPVSVDVLAPALRSYVARTCPPSGHESTERRAQIAAELRTGLPAAARDDFADAIGARAGAVARVRAAIARMAARGTELEVRTVLPRVRCRVDVIHGADDAIVPYEQARILGARLIAAGAAVHVIGSYAHTGFSTRRLGVVLRDALALVAILRALG